MIFIVVHLMFLVRHHLLLRDLLLREAALASDVRWLIDGGGGAVVVLEFLDGSDLVVGV